MSFKEIIDVPLNHQLVIQLPQNFVTHQKVVVTVEEVDASHQQKMDLMKMAIKDPRFLNDLNEVANDFDNLSHEGL